MRGGEGPYTVLVGRTDGFEACGAGSQKEGVSIVEEIGSFVGAILLPVWRDGAMGFLFAGRVCLAVLRWCWRRRICGRGWGAVEVIERDL